MASKVIQIVTARRSFGNAAAFAQERIRNLLRPSAGSSTCVGTILLINILVRLFEDLLRTPRPYVNFLLICVTL